MSIYRSIILVVCLLAPMAGTGAPAASADTLLERARAAEARGDHAEALALYREAWIHDTSVMAPRLAMARNLFAMDRLREAESALATVLLEAPSAEAHALHGQILYRTERVGAAVQAWQRSLQLREDAAVRRDLDRALRERQWTGGYRDAHSSSFVLRYESAQRSAREAALLQVLEETYDDLRGRLGGAPSNPIVVILYPETQFHEATLAPDRAIGLYDGKVRIPAGGIDLDDRVFRGTLVHEVTHAFLHHMGGERVPRWLHEGMAELMEAGPPGELERRIAEGLRRGGLPDWSRGFSYAQARSFVSYLVRRGGMGGITLLLDRIDEGLSPDEAVVAVYGRDLGELTRAWSRDLEERWL